MTKCNHISLDPLIVNIHKNVYDKSTSIRREGLILIVEVSEKVTPSGEMITII